MSRTIVEAIIENNKSIPDKVAIYYKNEKYTYKDINIKMRLIASYLNLLGIKKGDSVILEAISRPEYIFMFLAVQLLGAKTVPVERAISFENLKYIYELTDAKYFISVGKKQLEGINTYQYDKIISEAEEVNLNINYENLDSDEVIELIFTSGTTGKPKGTAHTIRGIECNTLNTVKGIGMLDSDVILLPLPLNHSFGLRVLRAAFFIGATVVLQNGSIFAKVTERNIEKYSCTAMVLVATAMEMFLDEVGEEEVSKTMGKLRYIEFSAGAVSGRLRKKLAKLLPNTEVYNTWGSSETGGSLFINTNREAEKGTSIGRPLDNIEIGIFAEDEDRLLDGSGENVKGRMALKGDMVMKGYWKQDELNEKTFVNGWLLTNDIIWRDKDGYIYMLGRADDIINIAGEKVSAIQIEELLLQMDGISSCGCIGVEDTESHLGQYPVVYYTCNSNNSNEINLETITQYLVTKMDNFKVPRKAIQVNNIPLTKMGKINRKALKSMYKDSGSSIANNPVIKNLLNRHSIRNFTEEPVSDEIIKVLLEVAKSAPSGKNLQTRRFTVIKNEKQIERLKKIIAMVAKREGTSFNGFNNPKVVILVSNDRRNKDGIQDASCSVENMLLALSSLGLGGVWNNSLMDICDEEEIRQILNEYEIPKNHNVWACVAIGYPAEEPIIFERKGNIVHYVS